MRQKTLILAVLLAVALIIISAGCIQEKETYNVGFSESNNILSTTDLATGEPKGVGIDVLNWIAENKNITFNYVKTSDYQTDLDKGVIDLMSWAVVTNGSRKVFDFSDFHIDLSYGFVAKKSSDYTVDDALSGDLTISCELDSPAETLLKDYFGESKFNRMVDEGKILQRFTIDAALVDVEDSRAGACISNSILLANRLTERESLKYIGSVGDKKVYATAVKSGNTELLEMLNAGFEDFTVSGGFEKISKEYGFFITKDTYVVGITKDFPPFAYLDENGKPAGFDVELIEWIAERNGFDIEYRYLSWGPGVSAVEKGEIDMFCSALTITNDRSVRVTFSNPYYKVGNAVAQKTGNGVTQNMFENGDAVVGLIDETTPKEWVLGFYGDSKSKKMIDEGKIKIYP
ncbi:MAG: transporter substrate-binding domain-containing protein, partial [Methanocorpusculum sp.]|nr:transporter substrate-binding domain-containing protein [Methanocorpusculum sp.]